MAGQRRRSGSPAIGDLSAVDAVERKLGQIAGRDGDLATGPLAAIALELARQLDGDNSATSKALCAKALQECLASLEVLAPADRKKDGIDELKERRSRQSRASN